MPAAENTPPHFINPTVDFNDYMFGNVIEVTFKNGKKFIGRLVATSLEEIHLVMLKKTGANPTIEINQFSRISIASSKLVS